MCLTGVKDFSLLLPCLKAFREERALPAFVLGPVDFSHGFNWRMRSACALRRSGGQPFVCFVGSVFEGMYFSFFNYNIG